MALRMLAGSRPEQRQRPRPRSPTDKATAPMFWFLCCLALGLASLAVSAFIIVASRNIRPIEANSLEAGLQQRNSTTDRSASNHTCSRIPKILHLTFASKLVYGNYRQYLKRCLALNPDWQVYLWRDSDSERFIRANYPDFAAKFSGYRGDLQKSDAVRYAVLHRFGGVYIDMDVECVRPMFPGLQRLSAFVDRERWEQSTVLFNRPLSLMNSVMGGPPGHPFFLHVLNSLRRSSDASRAPVDSTGPGALTRAHTDWLRTSEAKAAPAVTVLPSALFSGLVDPDNPAIRAKCQAMSADFESPGKLVVRKRLASELAGFDPDRPDSSPGAPARRRRLACASLALNDWWRPAARQQQPGNRTIGVHRFLHLGYGFAAKSRWPTFNLLAEFPVVRLYSGGAIPEPPVPMPPC